MSRADQVERTQDLNGTQGRKSFQELERRCWGFSSVVEGLPSKRKALGLVLSSGGKKKMKRKRKLSFLRFLVLE